MSQRFQRFAFALAILATVCVSAHAQRGGGGGGFGGGRGGGGGGRGGFGGFGGGATTAIFTAMRSLGDSPAQFATRSDVREELGITEDQTEELREVARSMGGRQLMEELGIDFRELGGLSSEEAEDLAKDIKTKVAKMHSKMMDSVGDILSTKQTKRLKELRFQYTALSQRNPAGALRSADIKVSDKDEKELKEKLEGVEKELQAKIAKLRRTAYMDALGDVVSGSRLEQLMGATFAFESGGFGAAFGGRGGPGGGRGGPGAGGPGGGRRPRGGDTGGNNRRRRPAGDGEEGGNRRRRPAGDDEEEGDDDNPRRRR